MDLNPNRMTSYWFARLARLTPMPRLIWK